MLALGSRVVLSSAEARLCLAETTTTLGILGTMLATVALVVAERKCRQGFRGAGGWESPLERWGRGAAERSGGSWRRESG